MTVTRYSTRAPPEFLTHRNFDDALVRRYLDVYYPYDPFYGYWCARERAGRRAAAAIFIARVQAGPLHCRVPAINRSSATKWGCCSTTDRMRPWRSFSSVRRRAFRSRDLERLESGLPPGAGRARGAQEDLVAGNRSQLLCRRDAAPSRPATNGRLPAELWPDLTAREREIAALILAGHPSGAIADRLRISPGTVRIHRHNIYAKLDITAEREVFLQYIEFVSSSGRSISR